MIRKIIFLYILLSSMLLASPVKTDHVELELISEVQSIQPGQSFWLGVLFKLAKDWHIYWQNPGDAGMAPKFRWTLPKNFKVGKIQWPYPERSVTSGIASFVYSDYVLLMTEVIPPQQLSAGEQIPLLVQVTWLECNDVCLPGKAELRLNLPSRNGIPVKNAVWQEIFSKTRAMLPKNYDDWQKKAALVDSTVNLSLKIPLGDVSAIAGMEFFPYRSTEFKNAAGQVFSSTAEGYRLNLSLAPTLLEIPEKVSGILVVNSGATKKEAIIIDLPLED